MTDEGDALRARRSPLLAAARHGVAMLTSALPNSPAGLISRTIAMMTKITVFEASG